MKETPLILGTKEIAKTSQFRIESVKLRFNNGEQRTFERMGTYGSKINAVMVIPVMSDGRFVMVEEYAVGTQSYQTGFPKGLVDQGETLEEGALRELKEEVGFGAYEIKLFKSIALSPQYMCHRMGLVIARELYESSLPGDEPEPLKVHYYTFHEAQALIQTNKLIDARSIAALYLAREFMENRK